MTISGAEAMIERPGEAEGPSFVPLVLARVRLRASRRAHWLRSLWSAEAERAKAVGTAIAAADAALASEDRAERERAFFASDAEALRLGAEIADVEARLARLPGSRLGELEALFGLDPRESDIVQACFALAIEPGLARGLAHLHDHAARAYLSEELLAALFEHGRARAFHADSSLAKWSLVIESPRALGEPPALVLDPTIRSWLLGEHRLDADLVGVATLAPVLAPLPEWPMELVLERVRRTVLGDRGAKLRVGVNGARGSGRRTFAAAVTAHLGLTLLVVDADAVAEGDWPRVAAKAGRQAFLDHCALAWIGDAAWTRRSAGIVPAFPLELVIGEEGSAAGSAGVDLAVEIPPCSVATRGALWLAAAPHAKTWPAKELDDVAARHRLTPGEIAAAGAADPRTAPEARAAIRGAMRHRLGEVASWVECTFEWDDLVVAEPIVEALRDFVAEARARPTFWEKPGPRRLFPQGRGLFALLSGSPGTGKTMAAQVIARALGLDLFRISLAATVSKWVGETSKNLERVLATAERCDAVLLFDEADALFGKRTEIRDAQDRFANTDTNHLLQAIEAHRGIAILATNKKANIDPAFTRRLRYVLELPKPTLEQRRLLWQRLLGELAPEVAPRLAPALDALAEVESSPAQIKYAVLSALFGASRDERPLDARHLARGLERELLKDSRGLDERERERIVRHAR